MIARSYGEISSVNVNLSSDKKRLLFRLSATKDARPSTLEFEMAVSLGSGMADVVQQFAQRAGVKRPRWTGKPRLRVVKEE